ncbi:MFS transporter [Nocardioides sp. Bht2]|uniref:MFS transporter n=1 Tax=Nocardioides sp. Bht2 TaxID=3392297 RepID=UPI0039B58DF0
MTGSGPTPARRWSILMAGTVAQTTSAFTIHGAPFLIPALRNEGMSLTTAASVAAAPTLGVMVALMLWGVLTDRRGERFVLIAGLATTAAAGGAAVAARFIAPDRPLALAAALFAAGACAASTSAASGRVAVGWFPPDRRGLAMGIRQTSQPLGVGLAAISLAVTAQHWGVAWALTVPVIASAIALVLVGAVVIDPPRNAAAAAETANPYRGDSYLSRVHQVAVLLVVPQFLVWTFALVWLVEERHWSPAAAGTLVAATQVAGAVTRIAAGHLSDRVGSRMRPTRWIAIAGIAVLLLLGATSGLGWGVAVAALLAASMITVADNGLAFAAVAERAGPRWSGRSMGLHNTAQFLAASAVPPAAGVAITHLGFAAVFAASALFPAVALALVPVHEEHPLS